MRSSKKHWIIIAFIAIVMLPIVLMCFKYKRYLKYAYYYVSPINSLIKSDTLLLIDTDTLRRIDPEYGDWLVHPCVRYIPDGLGGHRVGSLFRRHRHEPRQAAGRTPWHE